MGNQCRSANIGVMWSRRREQRLHGPPRYFCCKTWTTAWSCFCRIILATHISAVGSGFPSNQINTESFVCALQLSDPVWEIQVLGWFIQLIVYANIYKLALILPGCAAALAIYNVYSHQIRIYVYTILWMFSDALQKSFRDERNISDKLKKGVSEYLKSAPKRLQRYVSFWICNLYSFIKFERFHLLVAIPCLWLPRILDTAATEW